MCLYLFNYFYLICINVFVICQAVLIKIHVFCQDLKGYHLLFLEAMSLYYGEAGMQIERCREDCYDPSNLQAAGEKFSQR